MKRRVQDKSGKVVWENGTKVKGKYDGTLIYAGHSRNSVVDFAITY